MYKLSFISEKDFENHVYDTIKSYNKTLNKIDLKRFNSNIIDPIKLLFDKNVFNKTFEEIINLEIHRQRDKSNTNAIGYFHQNIFKYVRNCHVPQVGWDVIFKKENQPTIYVEMKNKHNTMNSSSSQKTYIQMQNQIMKTPSDNCFLVETIAPQSRNVTWKCSVNQNSVEDERIRRVSMDQFYSIVTNDEKAFYHLCMQLPKTIEKIIKDNPMIIAKPDTVLEELSHRNQDALTALYLLAFESYEGFNQLSNR